MVSPAPAIPAETPPYRVALLIVGPLVHQRTDAAPVACCARAASGHAAAPPAAYEVAASLGLPSHARSRTLSHCCARTVLCSAAKLIVEWQRWVNRGTLSTRQVGSSPRTADLFDPNLLFGKAEVRGTL